ncbi:hypothetical protein RND81_12G134800 [Saponaria officinalis]|uniref:DUF1985 domain-containing protein n=1 Tax=Saponaria officinalis TaxID=3572 RepID=A0AAW1HA37_SAPOF
MRSLNMKKDDGEKKQLIYGSSSKEPRSNKRKISESTVIDKNQLKVAQATSKKLKTSKGKSTEPNFPTLKTRMTPKGIFDFINNNLSERQISDIQEMGFEGILKLKTDKVPGQLAYWLVKKFNPFDSSLMGGQLKIRDEDIHLAIGIPNGKKVVVQASKKDESDEYRQSLSRWQSQFNGSMITKNDVLSRMTDQKEGGDDFKRNFIVYIVCTFLAGVKGVTPSLRVLKCLDDVTIIPELNWCRFTREAMVNNTIKWQKECEKGAQEKLFKGPIMILVFIYLDRVVFKLRSVPRTFPTLSTWSKVEIGKRIFDEKKEAGNFGYGLVDSPLVKENLIDVGAGVDRATNDSGVNDGGESWCWC